MRAGTLIFKDLVIPQWWLEWVIPLTSLAMGMQALEMLVALHPHARAASPRGVRARPGHPAGGNAVSWVSILT